MIEFFRIYFAASNVYTFLVTYDKVRGSKEDRVKNLKLCQATLADICTVRNHSQD